MSRRPSASRRVMRPFVPADLTPMVDVVFLLIVFFILVSQLTRTERTPITLPALSGDLLSPSPMRERVVVHVEPNTVRIGSTSFQHGGGAREAIAEHIRRILTATPSASVVVRAPRDAPFIKVSSVLAALRDAGAADVRLIARETPR